MLTVPVQDCLLFSTMFSRSNRGRFVLCVLLATLLSACASNANTKADALAAIPESGPAARDVAQPSSGSGVSTSTGGGEPVTVAVFDFENGGGVPDDPAFDGALAAVMIEQLQQDPRITIVERMRLSEILAEQRLSRTDLVDPETRLRVGHLVGAHYLVFGTYAVGIRTPGQPPQGFIAGEMDDVVTGRPLDDEEKRGSPSDLSSMELSRGLAVEFAQALERRIAASASGAKGSSQSEAQSAFDAGLALEQKGDYAGAAASYQKALILNPNLIEARTHFEQASEAAARQ